MADRFNIRKVDGWHGFSTVLDGSSREHHRRCQSALEHPAQCALRSEMEVNIDMKQKVDQHTCAQVQASAARVGYLDKYQAQRICHGRKIKHMTPQAVRTQHAKELIATDHMSQRVQDLRHEGCGVQLRRECAPLRPLAG